MRFYKIMRLKAYFDKGYALLNYVTKVLMLVGFADVMVSDGKNITRLFIFGVIYAIICFGLGLVWFHFKIINAEFEVQNRVDPFVQEMRKVYKEQ